MITKILKKDISRNKVITATLFLFILLAAILASGAVNIIFTLFGSMDSLFNLSSAPHYVQMHTGEINQAEIDDFSKRNPLVKSQQTVTMLGINGAFLYLGHNESSEANSIIENSFVTQSNAFDFLLDTESNIIALKDGEIAVPIYHMQKYGLQIGDSVRVVINDFNMEFTITAFVRDVQMNPSIVTSKRFVVSEKDWNILCGQTGEVEYLIEFQLQDVNQESEFAALYQASGLPQKDTAITYSLYRLLNALTDGVVAAVIVLISLLLIAIAMLCLRFTLIAAIEEDFREIGVMKAIGISNRDMRRLYMGKYIVMAASAGILGYAVSFFVGNVFTANITLYMGSAPKTIWNIILPALGSVLVFLTVVLFCQLTLRRFRKISAVEALRDGFASRDRRGRKAFRLSRSKLGSINIFLGIKTVCNQFSTYGVLCFIFTVCAFLMVVPLNFLNTLNSPDFVSYMGAGRCDIRMDVFSRQGEDMAAQYSAINQYLEADGEVNAYASFVTAAYKVKNSDGMYENIKVEIGDFSVFPLEYLRGAAPETENEIALSSMNADELKKSTGDTLTLLVGDVERTLTVSGIYQDVTNGGKTAKGLLPYTPEDVLWYIVNIDVAEGVSVPLKIEAFNRRFSSVKVTDMAGYVSQTLGGLIKQLSLASLLAFVLALAVAVLITAMFFRMLIAKESYDLAIMRGLGFSFRDMRLQYITRAILVLLAGILIGSFSAVTLGQGLAGMLISGISSLRFVINPLFSFIICPLSLATTVGITVFLGSASIKKINVMLVTE